MSAVTGELRRRPGVVEAIGGPVRRRGAVTGLILLIILAGSGLVGPSLTRALGEGPYPVPSELQHVYPAGLPSGLDELRLMESHQRELIPKLARATVAVQVGGIQGSGVIISSDGVLLTAAHVASQPGMRVQVTLADGQQTPGWSLGMNRAMDAGMVKLDPQVVDGKEVSWPFAALGSSKPVKVGTWCLALGHPGGYQKGREPVVRIGRVTSTDGKGLTTDCKLVGGDSGGPLFDLRGTVIGIHSRIGTKLSKNVHVPVAAFRDAWDRLASGEVWGSLSEIVGQTVLGVYGATDSDEARIRGLMPGSPAEQAGLQPGDLFTRFADQKIERFATLQDLVRRRKPGDEVQVEVLRQGKRLRFSLVLGGLRSAE